MRGPQTSRTRRARSLRKADNGAEAKLWHALRNRQLNGRKFVRQLGIGPYFADFACRESLLVVEVDGSQHSDSERDPVRNHYMNANGWAVARFWNGDVLQNTGDILDTIAAICDGVIVEAVKSFDFQFYPALRKPFAPHPNPLPAGGEKGQKTTSIPSPRLRGEGGSQSRVRGEDADTEFMRKALVKGLGQMGRTWPNPSVGCVIVKDGKIIGDGATGDGGRPHAEEIALIKAGQAARGATAYVTLEPCGQRSTGAASCSEKLVTAGVSRVVYACADPSPLASHMGPQRMKDAGLTVESGLMAESANFLILGFVHFLETGLPLVYEFDGNTTFDAEFFRNPTMDVEADLRAWAAKGYRHLFVHPGSEAAADLRTAGLSMLPPDDNDPDTANS